VPPSTESSLTIAPESQANLTLTVQTESVIKEQTPPLSPRKQMLISLIITASFRYLVTLRNVASMGLGRRMLCVLLVRSKLRVLNILVGQNFD